MYFCTCALFQPYPPTINFLECWMHLSDGSAKVVTLSHHPMRASNDCLREIVISSNVFENISHPCLLSLYLLLANTWRVSFWLMLSVSASVWCRVLWNGSLVLQDAHSGISITFLEDPNLRFTVSRQHQRPNKSSSTRVFSLVAKNMLEWTLQLNTAFQICKIRTLLRLP